MGVSEGARARGGGEVRTYSCFNFRLRTSIPLGELIPAEADDDPRPVVEVRLGAVPAELAGASEPRHGLQVAGELATFTVPKVGRYLVDGGREIVVEPFPGGSERDLRLFLLGSALGILCHQRGLLPLHANAIVVDEGAVAFAGHSGSGKSTLAAHFQRAGYEILCDDVCVISFEGGTPSAWPGLPRLKLWGDAVAAFGHDPAGLDQAIEGMDKYHVPLESAGLARPIPFRRLYLLSRSAEAEESELVRLTGVAAMEAIMAQTYRGAYLGPMGLAGRHFRQCATLASSAAVFAAPRTWGYDVLEREAKRLEEHFSAG